jgi:hypothetical protein
MDEIPILAREDARDAYRQLLALHGAPAYVRRAFQVEEAYQQLLHRCRQQRDEWLTMVRLRLATLWALVGDAGEVDDAGDGVLVFALLRPLLADEEQVRVLEELYMALAPQLRQAIEPTNSQRKLQKALAALRESIERFNSRWKVFLPTVDLRHVNELRDGYNRYYLLEKECAMRSPRLARQGYRPLPPLTTSDLAHVLQLLAVPRCFE